MPYERDIILSYLGVKRPIGTHCNSDCRNEKCESYHYATKELPSAGPERMKGKWIRITQGTMPGQYMCPFCHRTIENYGIEELLSIRYPYCHCGADMRDEDHEISYGGFITTDDMLDFGYESVEDLAVAFAEFLKNNMRGDDHA